MRHFHYSSNAEPIRETNNSLLYPAFARTLPHMQHGSCVVEELKAILVYCRCTFLYLTCIVQLCVNDDDDDVSAYLPITHSRYKMTQKETPTQKNDTF